MNMRYDVICVNSEEDKSYYGIPHATVGQRFVRVVFDNDSKVYNSFIRTNKEGYEYFDVPNIRNTTYKSFLNRMFYGRIGDAIAAVFDGEGDEISISRECYIHVLKYLDREYGEAVRKYTIEKYKNSDIRYVICINRCFYPTNSGGVICGSIHRIDDRISYFDSEEEAVKACRLMCRSIVETIIQSLKNNDTKDIVVHAPNGYEAYEKFMDRILLIALNVKEELFYGDSSIETIINEMLKSIRVEQLISVEDGKSSNMIVL